MRKTSILGLSLLGIGLGAGAGLGLSEVLPESPLALGVRIASRPVPRGTTAEEFVANYADNIGERDIVFRNGETLRTFRFSDLGIGIDQRATVNEAKAVAHEGSIVDRLRQTRAAKRGEIDIPVRFTVDDAAALGVIEDLAKSIDVKPTDAEVDMASLNRTVDKAGREVDVGATLQAITQSDFQDGEIIDLVIREVPAKIRLADLKGVEVEKVVASFETTFHLQGTGAGRAVNIANAAHFINGTVLMPGEVFSFNEHVGPRTLERGFTWAPEMQADELTTGVGGGTCQCSSTLFAAALFSSLEIVERRSHSRPSSYTKLGLDATVIYPSQDLKIKNTLPFGIMIHAFLPTPDSIKIEIRGGEPVADVSYSFGIGNSEDFLRRITVKPNLSPTDHLLHQRGSRGYDVTSLVRLKFHDGRSEEHSYFSGYRPTPEVFWVGPGYDEKDLPPLPEHARGVEGRVPEDALYSAL